MTPQQVISPTSSSSVPVSPSMVQHQKINNNNKKKGGSYDNSSIINNNNDNEDLLIISNMDNHQHHRRRYSLSRQSLQDVSNNYESLSYSDDNNLIDLTSQESLQSSTDTVTTFSYPAHQEEVKDGLKKGNGTADISSDIMDYQSNNNNNNNNIEQFKEDKINERGNPAACIFVASLTKGKNDEELNVSVTKHFEQWGSLLNVKVLKDWLGRPYAFVQFERIQDANTALTEAPGTLLDGRNIRCEPARVNRTISISSCGPPLILQQIQIELAEFGKIEDITVLHNYPLPTNNNSGNNVGECIFVKYCYRDDAVKAFLTLSKMNQKWCIEWASNLDTTMGKHNAQVTHSTSDLTIGNFNGNNNDNNGRGRSFSQERVNIFIGNLFDDIIEENLKERFKKYGIILDLRIIRKTIPFKRVFAFIRYKDYTEAKKAIQMENGLEWHSRKLRVSYREPRESPIGFGFNRRITMERPHPPGLGFPASEHQYLISNNNIKKKMSATTLSNNKLKVEENEMNKNKNSSKDSTWSSDNKKNMNGENDKEQEQQQQQRADEKTATDNDEQRQQQQQQKSINNNNKTSKAIHQKQQQQCVDNNFSSLSTIPPPPPLPPLHNVGMNRGYMKLPPGGDHLYHPVTHRHPHQQHYMTPTIYDPSIYPPLVMNPKDQQQAPMMFGSMQDAGTTLLEGNVNSAQNTIENNLIFVPGHYDYTSGIYYGPCYHSVSTPLLTNGPPSLVSSSTATTTATTTPSTLPVTTPPIDTLATNAINDMFNNHHHNGKTNGFSDNYNNYKQSSMQRTSMNHNKNNGILPTASGYYYMMPPPLLPLHQQGHSPHNHQSMYHQLQTNLPSTALHHPYHHSMNHFINGDYNNNKYTRTSNTTSMPLSPMNEQNNKQQRMDSTMNKKGCADSTKKMAIPSPTTTNNNKNASEQQQQQQP
ncbi:hypothetical protein INT45_003414 [Circinella minor]|uniref:RRM domain-containing protein n=1 Tax=Circinella minor TaxID=1195481 RepID=A0A8H7S1D4_9FUNG|nr:hypothetical protein INT45_003414 [Circinella minor]